MIRLSFLPKKESKANFGGVFIDSSEVSENENFI